MALLDDIQLSNPHVWLIGATSSFVTTELNENELQFGTIKNLSASASLRWSINDNVMFMLTGAKKMIYNGTTYFEIKEENILFREQVTILP